MSDRDWIEKQLQEQSKVKPSVEARGKAKILTFGLPPPATLGQTPQNPTPATTLGLA